MGRSERNTRVANGAAWRKLRARLKAEHRCCWICGKPIDYTLTFWIDPADGKRKLHPYSFEMDEITPHADGGRMVYSNVRAAHRICNQRRGKKKPAQVRAAAKPAPVVRHSREW